MMTKDQPTARQRIEELASTPYVHTHTDADADGAEYTTPVQNWQPSMRELIKAVGVLAEQIERVADSLDRTEATR